MPLDTANSATALRDYRAKGWKTFPVVRGQKTPAVINWQQGTIVGEHNPEYFNIGIVTGQHSGIVVLDIDHKSGGWESLTKLQEKYGELPDTLGAYTANHGYHFYFAAPNVPVRNGARILGFDGIDIRGDGGYVVAPPSILESGRVYTWDTQCTDELAPLPVFLIDRVVPRVADTEASEFYPEGTRNDSLARLGGSLRRFGLSYGIIEATLLEANDEKCNPPLSVGEVKNIAKSVTRYEPSFRAGGRESGTRGGSSDQWGRPNEGGLPEGRSLFRGRAPSGVRRGAWYLGKRG